MDVDLLNWDAVLYREYRLMWPLAFQRSSVSYEVPFGALTVGKMRCRERRVSVIMLKIVSSVLAVSGTG